MKVCTDACLFGALTSNFILSVAKGQTSNHKPQTSNCLDIGTGTGLLSLMFAQKNHNAVIDAVEIDTGAAEQAKENFSASPWKERLNILNENILSFTSRKNYDLIISNPPFFENDLRSPDRDKNNAKHDTSLSLTELLQVVKPNLTTDGVFAVLLPYQRVHYFIEEAAASGLYLTQQVLVKQSGKHDFFRGILFLGRKKTEPLTSSINIKDKEGNYTPEFIAALQDYYLYL